MKVNEELILRLESLSMLSLSKAERDNIKPGLENMIKMVNKLSDLDTSGCSPLVNTNSHNQVLRSDKSGDMLSNPDAIKNTKFNSNVYFTVPKVLK